MSILPPSRCASRTLRAVRYFSQCSPRARDHLPSTAPKPSIDIKHIRLNPELHSRNCLERNYKAQSQHPFKIVQLFDQWRQSQIRVRSLREKGNATRAQLSQDNPERSREGLIQEGRELKTSLSSAETHEAQVMTEIETLALELPNLTSSETPREEPRIVGYNDQHPKPKLSLSTDGSQTNHRIPDHTRIGAELDLIDFSGAATTSGWGWYDLDNEAALLEDALVSYALSIAMKHGFAVKKPASMVYSHIASACGFRPRDQNGEQQVYNIQQTERDTARDKPAHVLAGTAEIPFAGRKANAIIQHEDLPIRFVGSSRCFRQEAGARGADTKGLFRVHEFTKAEMFAWTNPGAETEICDSMLAIQKEILEGLGLHYRILEMPASDLGANATRKQDIEVLFPSRMGINNGWGEVTSTSICTDYQTRRLNTRFKNPKGAEGKVMGFPSTVNGTAMAVPRVLAALLEYHYQVDEGTGMDGLGQKQSTEMCVRIPEVLWPWMHGRHVIRKEKLRMGT